MTRRQNRTFVKLELPKSVPPMIVALRGIIARGRTSPWLPSPNPVLDRLSAALDKLAKAQVDAATGEKGKASRRNELLQPVISASDAYKAQVQEVTDANPDEAGTILASSGLSSRAASTRRKAQFSAKPSRVSGSVDVDVKAPVKDARYDWEFSVDGGKTFKRAPSTKQSKTTISNLPVGQYVLIRYRVLTRKGEGDWSDPVEVLVR